mmetsp:Transcript_125576/g.326053  ORF Transcript_125576/g.326053 Transcript_125576/m.326053 type:complete len:250 (-) Transcript_125576:536-1285(-)
MPRLLPAASAAAAAAVEAHAQPRRGARQVDRRYGAGAPRLAVADAEALGSRDGVLLPLRRVCIPRLEPPLPRGRVHDPRREGLRRRGGRGVARVVDDHGPRPVPGTLLQPLDACDRRGVLVDAVELRVRPLHWHLADVEVRGLRRCRRRRGRRVPATSAVMRRALPPGATARRGWVPPRIATLAATFHAIFAMRPIRPILALAGCSRWRHQGSAVLRLELGHVPLTLVALVEEDADEAGAMAVEARDHA